MSSFGQPSSSNPHRSYWTQIYQDQPPPPDQLQVSSQIPTLSQPALARMQSSRSHMSLKDLPAGLEGLHLDRTASSTPAARHKTESSTSQSAMLTPPVDSSVVDPFLVGQINKRENSKERSMYLESKKEDDVFRGDTGAKVDRQFRPVPPGQEDDVFRGDTATKVDKQFRPVPPGQEVIEYVSPKTKITPRSDRLSDPITPQNAQGVLPPDACVFVANLSVSRTDDQLEESVHASFDQFGDCIVKVRRDRHRHPFALVQYYSVDDAIRAIEGGRDMVVDDRKIRTERAEARREYMIQNGDTGSSHGTGSVVLSKVGGGPISKDEAEGLLSQYGPVQEMYPTTHQDARLHGVPEGMWIKFAYYLDFKDALKMFNNTTTLYKVIEPPNLEPRIRPGPVASSSPVVQGLRTPRSTTDQKSIFVGNLPEDVSELELKEIFAQFGDIKGCNVIRKPITGGSGFNIFGFIEYSDVTQAERAAVTEIDIRGQRIRVEPKEYSARRHTRLQPYGTTSSAERPPRGVAWGPSNNVYQSPDAAVTYGLQPFYFHGPQPGGMPPYQQNYGWVPTPPSSGQRRRAPTADGYIFGGSPHPAQYLQLGHPAFSGMAFAEREGEDHQHPPRRYR